MSPTIPSRRQVAMAIALLVTVRIVAFVLMGATRAGGVFTHTFEVGINILAISCAVAAGRRGRATSRIFWFLFAAAFALQMVADIGWTYCIFFNITVPEAALFPSLFYRLYAVPMAIALFLSEDMRASKLETFLDSCIVVGLVGLCMYQVQLAELKPHDPKMGQLITTGAVVNMVLVLAAVIRFALSTPGALRRLFGRLAVYLAVYSFIAFATSYVDAYFPGIDDAFDLIWAGTYLTAAALAVRWRPSPDEDKPGKPRISRRSALLCFNLTMATMVLASAVLGLRVVDASRMVGLIAVGLVLFSYAVRCALMQDTQEKYVAAITESNTRYECVSLATNDVLWDRNLENDRISWNDNVCSLFGYQRSEVDTDRNWWINNIHPDDREPILSSVHNLLAGDKNAWSGEYRFRRADGSYAFVFDRCYVSRDSFGTPVRMIGSIQDLTVRKQAELEIQRARHAAEAAAKAKTEFLSNMSHEIRTPLNGIMGMLELASQTSLTSEQKELVTMARESADGLFSVVNDVLDFSKIEAGRMELENIEFDVSDTVAEAARTILVRAHQKNLDLTYYVAADVPSHLAGDPARLKQVLVNLLGNAVKFTDKGQILLRVETEKSNASEVALRFSVADTGMGIPPEKLKAVFHAFSQADSSITRKFGGTGLGLAISSEIVELLKGKIWVESEIGKGSTFFFTASFGRVSSLNATATPGQRIKQRGVRILVLEPHPESQAFLQDTLISWGADVVTAATADQALQLLGPLSKDRGFSLLLCDSHLPGTDCFALIEQARRLNSSLPEVIVMLTSENYASAIASCQKLKIAGHLIKPFKRSELLSVVEEVVLGEARKNEAAQLPSAEPATLRQWNILLAEDNLVNQKVALRMLQKLGHIVEVVENGQQALEKVQSGSFDLVLMDGHMPEMDGLAATRAIREWEKYRNTHIPIIAMTAMAMEGDHEACLLAGMDAFIPKPVIMRILKETIQQVMDASERAGLLQTDVGERLEPVHSELFS